MLGVSANTVTDVVSECLEAGGTGRVVELCILLSLNTFHPGPALISISSSALLEKIRAVVLDTGLKWWPLQETKLSQAGEGRVLGPLIFGRVGVPGAAVLASVAQFETPLISSREITWGLHTPRD